MTLNRTGWLYLATVFMASIAHAQTPVINQESELLIPDRNHFGGSVAVDNGIMVVGAFESDHNGTNAGAAYLYDAATGALLRELVPNDIEAGDAFGHSVAIQNGLVAVSSLLDDDNGTNSGAVYLFNASTGTQIGKLLANDGDPRDRFGFSIAMSDSHIAIGAPSEDDALIHSGSVYLFNVFSHQQIHKLLPDDTGGVQSFGTRVDIDNGFVVVGAYASHEFEGTAYVFDTSTGDQLHQLIPTNPGTRDWFGYSVAIENQTIAVSAIFANNTNHANENGAVYLFNAINGLQIRKLVPDTIDDFQSFGHDLDIHNGLVLVGASSDGNMAFNAGAAYLFNSLLGTQLAKIYADDVTDFHRFGSAVAFDGDTICIGAIDASFFGYENGSAYIFDASTFLQLHHLYPLEKRPALDLFGTSLALDDSGSFVAVGMSKNDEIDTNAGIAYLYDASGNTHYNLLTMFKPDAGSANGLFGGAIDYDNAIVAVSASGDSDNGSGAGAVYIFGAFTGDKLEKITPNDPAPNDFFGGSIALDTSLNGGTLAVGADHDDDNGVNSGSVYLFNPFTGAQTRKITPSDGQAGDFFGQAIAMDQGILAIGAPRDNLFTGSVYLYDASTGTQLFKLVPNDSTTFDLFGSSVAVDEGIVAVGAIGHDGSGTDTGAVYLFDTKTGDFITKFVPSDAIEGQQFGKSVSIDRGLVAIGAWKDDDNGSVSGSAYLFGATTRNELYKLIPTDGIANAEFGNAIAVNNGSVVVGSSKNDEYGQDSGKAYVFTIPDDFCPADFTNDYSLNFFDVSAFLIAFGSQDPTADINGDGNWNFFDVSAFLSSFNAGCP